MTAGVLSSEAAAVAAMVGAVAADAEKAYIDSLPDEDLFDAVATVQSELEKAKAALARKRPAPERLTSTKGPFAFFEGTPIDCGAVADAAVDAYMGALSDVELEAMATQTQAELAAAVAALEKKRAARGGGAGRTGHSERRRRERCDARARTLIPEQRGWAALAGAGGAGVQPRGGGDEPPGRPCDGAARGRVGADGRAQDNARRRDRRRRRRRRGPRPRLALAAQMRVPITAPALSGRRRAWAACPSRRRPCSVG